MIKRRGISHRISEQLATRLKPRQEGVQSSRQGEFRTEVEGMSCGSRGGARLADRIDAIRLSAAFAVLVLGVAAYTATGFAERTFFVD